MKLKKIIISLLIISLLILSGCGGYSTLYHIQEIDYYSKINLKIPLHIPAASVGGEYLYMLTNDDMEDIKAELEAFSQEYNFSFINIRENALLLFYSKALFLLEKYVPDNPSQSKYKHYYRLLDFSSCLYPEDKKFEKVNGQMIRQIKGIPMPHYLFTEKSLGSQYPGLESIVVTEGIDGFQEFYELFNQYYDDYIPEVKKEDNQLTLVDVPVEFEIINTYGQLDKEYGILSEVQFKFYETIDGKQVVIIDFSI